MMLVFFAVLVSLAAVDCRKQSHRGNSDGHARDEGDELVLVHGVWRHGDRTPTLTWPTNAQIDWPIDNGQLSATGMQQHFHLGQIIAERYSDFIGPIYRPAEVYTRTTEYDRTVMSALSNLAGMFKGRPGVTIPDESDWPGLYRPVSLFNIPRYVDNILQISAICPKLDDLREELRASPEFDQFWSENEEVFNTINTETGLGIPPEGMKMAYYQGYFHGVTDAILIYKEHDKPVPDWVTDELFHKMHNMSLWWFYHNFADHNINRLVGGGGSLLKDIVDRMNLKAACKNDPSPRSCSFVNDLKYHIYSSHDTTVGAFTDAINAFDIRERELPGYTGCILVELWYKNAGHFKMDNFYVKVYYRQNPEGEHSEFERISVLDCGFQKCKLTKLTETAKAMDLYPEDWEAECTADTRKRAAVHPYEYSALD